MFYEVCMSVHERSNLLFKVGISPHEIFYFRVISSMGGFLLSYLPLFFTFAMIYHIILPQVPVFSNLGDAFIKVNINSFKREASLILICTSMSLGGDKKSCIKTVFTVICFF